jgi:TatD DNase family protein
MYLDAHTHIDRYDLVDEQALDSALAEIAQHRILTISNSMDLASYQRNLEIGERCRWVVPIFGVHPWQAPDYADRLDELGEALEQTPMIGEVGLDHHFVADPSAYPAQRKVLEFLLGAAREQDKIVTLHTKGAEREVLALLDQVDLRRVIVHWYSGPLDIFRELVARGVYLTVGLEVLYSEHIRTIAQGIPLGKLLTETDNPGGPKELIGGPGRPVLIQEVVREVAAARGTTVEAILQAVQANWRALIGEDPRFSDLGGVLEEGGY